jgi:hypothetical protein
MGKQGSDSKKANGISFRVRWPENLPWHYEEVVM